MTSQPQRSYRASSPSPDTGAESPEPFPFARPASSRPHHSDGSDREQAVNPITPHRLAQIMADADMADAINARLKETRHVSINAPSFADYFDEYARMAVGIVGLGTLALGLLLWGAF